MEEKRREEKRGGEKRREEKPRTKKGHASFPSFSHSIGFGPERGH